MKKILFTLGVVSALMLLPATALAQDYIRNINYSYISTPFTQFNISAQSRVVAHFKLHKNTKYTEYGIFGFSYFGLEFNQGNNTFYYRFGDGNFNSLYGSADVYDKDIWIDFGPERIILDVGKQDPYKHTKEITNVTKGDMSMFPYRNYIDVGYIYPNSETGQYKGYADITVYDFKIYDGDKLMHHGVPSKWDTRYGLFDAKYDHFDYFSSANGSISKCNVHKYVRIEQDGNDHKYYAHCRKCDEKVPISTWKTNADVNITAVDPYFDVEADGEHIGQQKTIVTCANPISKVMVIDKDENECLYDETIDNEQYAMITLPQTDKKRNLVTVVKTIEVTTNDTQQDTASVWVPAHFEQKPFHEIHTLRAGENKTLDADKMVTKSNGQLIFNIYNPNEEDIMDADQFIVERAFNDDFSDAVVVGSAAFGDDKDGKFTFDDESDYYESNPGHDDNTYCVMSQTELNNLSLDETSKEIIKSFYTVPDYHVNYRVSRAMATSLWPQPGIKFSQTTKVRPTSILPPVSSIQVEKTRNWSEDKTVKLKVLLKNPLPWEFNSLLDSEKVKSEMERDSYYASFIYRRYMWNEKAKILIHRYSPKNEYYQDTDYAAKDITIDGSDVKWDENLKCFYAEVEDVQNLPYLHYYYTATTDRGKSIIPLSLANVPAQSSDKEADESYSETVALIDSLVADRGMSKGQIVVRWSVGSGEKTSLKLQRRALNSGEDWKDMNISSDESSFIDKDIRVGTVYEYRLVASLEYRGSTYESVEQTMGWCSVYGTIGGKVILPDGTGLANAKVKLHRTTPVYIPDVTDADGNIILQGVHEGAIASVKANTGTTEEDIHDYPFEFVDYATTDENGMFRFDDVLYTSDGATSTITVEYGVCSFDPSTFTITLSGKRCEYDDVDFICTTTNKFVGRVLYENSTVPVKGAGFLINGQPMKNSKGQPVSTDQDGNFAFNVPQAEVTLKVYKEGHTFVEDRIMDKDGNTTFTPNQDYSGLILYDNTKVRLVGRITGGNTQGKKPLGFGESKNNLGDDLTMVLQLEGNNTAQIVYLKDDPENTQIDFTTTHPHKGTTTYSLQKKRIVIHPDTETGEFFVDLFPTKYKITQLSAQGYSTLFAEGEGFEVMDLTDSIHHHTDAATIGETGKTVDYSAKYNRIFHNPVTLTYQQSRYGMKVGYFGEDKINERNLLGTKFNATVASVDKASGEVTYTFGHPVFVQGNKYTLQVRAHEDYYYNGDTSTRPDEVNLDGGTLHVHNGLNSSDINEMVYELDSLGMRTIVFDTQNTNFSLTGEDALKSLRMQVEVNGYYYDAEPLTGFVLGSRLKGTDALASFDTEKGLIDVIRDPYGATSSAYRESGTTYHWNYDYSNITEHNLQINLGVGAGGQNFLGCLTFSSSVADIKVVAKGNINIPLSAKLDSKNGLYEMTLTDRISTSSDVLDVGAMADVYLGYGTRTDVLTHETVSIIDGKTYEMVSEGIKKGAIKLLTSGKDASGNEYYVVIGDKVGFNRSISEVFAYSQKHILGTLIPNIEKKRDALLLEGTEAEVQAIADETGKEQYLITSKENNEHKMIIPTGQEAEAFVDRVKEYNNQILSWQGLVYTNEEAKISAQNSNNIQHISVAGTTVEHSEGAAQYYVEKNGVSLPNAVTGGVGASANDDPKNPDNYVYVAGIIIDLSINYQKNITKSETKNYYQVESMGSGYTLSTNDNGYLDIDVCNVVADKAIMINDKLKEINGTDVEAAKIHDYVYYVRGGALRNPWYAPDSTLFYNPGTPLGVQTLKIDNPRIYIENPVVSNLPDDEAAYFTIRMTNDSEISDNTKYLNPSQFVLKEDDSTNAGGAQLFIDGMPLGTGRDFYISPGESITKTLEVRRGTEYDYDNLKLFLRDGGVSLFDYATISVHYLPTATKLTMTSPKDKWVMNTLSATDDRGYYIPVTVGDFNTNSDGFHHIEIQYKKETEGESQYVNLCSYYSDSTLFAAANGEKEMLHGGKIDNFKFYGEKDPIEMKYDLRAVSFRQLGTGFTTRASNIMSGTKDTRCPQVFGLPTPTNSILTYEDVLTLNFTEPIAYNYLDKTSNFQVMGYTNETDILQSSTLQFPGDAEQDAYSSISRNLANRDFTIDMMIKKAGDGGVMTLFSHGNETEYINFFITPDNRLAAVIAGHNFQSVPLDIDLTSALTHVGMAYDHKTGLVKFFANNTYLENYTSDKHNIPVKYTANGQVHLGTFYKLKSTTPFKGNMLDVRLWGKVLSEAEVSGLKGKRLTGYEQQLIANWPLNETNGTIAKDRVHGANLNLNGLEWDNVEGYSLHIDKEPIELVAKELSVGKEQDYTIQFWFKVDDIDNAVVAEQSGRCALMKMGDDHLGKGNGRLFIGFEKENMVVNSNDTSMVIGKKANFADKEWHHFAMTVNRSQNTFFVYLDRNLTYQSDAHLIDGLASDYAALGDKAMVGNFDIFVEWETALADSYIKEFFNSSFFGTEMGMKTYLPFHYNTTNSQNTRVLEFSGNNEVMKYDIDGNVTKTKKQVIASTLEDKNKDEVNHAPVKESPMLQNLDFSWSSTGNALQLNINELDSKINKQYIYITVRGVEDLCGNTMISPMMWSCYVDKNLLKWDEQSIDITTSYTQSATERIYWRNTSGKRLDYNINNIPSWLTIDKSSGTATAEQEAYVTLTSNKDLAPGKYTETIYIEDENGLADPMIVNLTVLAEETGWKVDKTKFDRTMNLMGKVMLRGYGDDATKEFIDDNPEDQVGAFIMGECVGVANITNDPSLGSYVFMTIYADSLIASSNPAKNITLLLWRHDSGIIQELENVLDGGVASPVTFKTNSAVGLPPAQPLTLKVSDKMEQDLYLTEGWNWVSFNVSPRAVDGINSVFINQAGLFSDDDMIKHVDFAQYSEKYMSWLGTLGKTDYKNVYQIFVRNAGTYKLLGNELTQDDMRIEVKPGWNDMPYLLQEAVDINTALADLQIGDKAKTGDIIKSLDEFAVAQEAPDGEGTGKWIGTLKYLTPGKGYYLKHSGEETSFTYQKNVLPNNDQPKANVRNEVINYEYNMPMIATFADDVDYQEGDKLAAYVNGVKVGETEMIDGRFFLSVNADDGDVVVLAQERDGNVVGKSPNTLMFVSNGVVGSIKSPYRVSLKAETSGNDNTDIYNIKGMKLNSNQQPMRDIYIINGKKVIYDNVTK